MSDFDLQLDFSKHELPRFIAVEGAIGVGKTTLAKHLARLFHYETLLEQPQSNPFLEQFYRDPKVSALANQLHFLLQRAEQLRGLHQSDLFEPVRVADFLIDKDQLFAEATLNADELNIYKQVYQQLTIDAPTPDLVIYLQAPTAVLRERIRRRGVDFEQNIDLDYLERLNQTYTEFFHYYDKAPLLIVNAADLDLADDPAHFKQLVDVALTIKRGRHYYNPSPMM